MVALEISTERRPSNALDNTEMLPVFFFDRSSALSKITAGPPREPQDHQGERQNNERVSQYGIHLLSSRLVRAIYVSTKRRTELSFELALRATRSPVISG
jgi:hypothetical protein